MTFVHQDFVNKVCLAKNVGRAGLRDCRDMSIWKQPSQFAERGYTHHRITQPIWRAYDDAIDGGGVSIFHKWPSGVPAHRSQDASAPSNQIPQTLFNSDLRLPAEVSRDSGQV